jgi:predicted glycosyltransferase
MNRPSILIYAQYLKGIGHLVRAKRIAEELARAGSKVTLIVGGPEIPDFVARGVDVRPLPPLLASAGSYSILLKADGTQADTAYLDKRRDLLLAVYDEIKPDILITEAYPMGRWAMQFELEPLLIAAHARRPERPMIVASLRDILQMPKRAEKSDLSVAMFAKYYDHMLVHGDPSLVRIEDSFPPLTPFINCAHYTGMVAPEPASAAPTKQEAFDVIVSAGGGAAAFEVLQAAIGAKCQSRLADASWLALAGPRMADDAFVKLSSLASSAKVKLERHRSDLAGLMAQAKLSIQRAGYNTVSDLMRTDCRAILIPDAANRQTEQTLRAEKLAQLGRASVVHETELFADRLARAIDDAMATEPVALSLNLDGAARTAEIVSELFAAHQAGNQTA